MWQEFYEIAERQMFARKFNKVKGNALKALRLAIKAKDHEGVVETYNLLADFYWYTRDRRMKDTIVASIKYAEKHLGGDSLTLANQLSKLAFLELKDAPQRAEQLKRRYIDIVEKNAEDTELLKEYDHIIEFYFRDMDKPAEAEIYQLRHFELSKKVYGPFYESLKDDLEYYSMILEELGEREKSDELSILSDRCFGYRWNFSDNLHALHATLERIYGRPFTFNAQPGASASEIDATIEELRAAATELDTVTRADSEDVACDLFFAVRRQAARAPYYWVKSILAERLYLLKNRDSLFEAKDIWRELSEVATDDSKSIELWMRTALELAIEDESFHAEVDHAMERLPTWCAVRLYAEALLMFIRNGDSPDSREKLREAILRNPLISGGLSPEWGSSPAAERRYNQREADEYIVEFGDLWKGTLGALTFMDDVISEARALAEKAERDKKADAFVAPIVRSILNAAPKG